MTNPKPLLSSNKILTMFRKLSTFYETRRQTCSEKVRKEFFYVSHKLSIILHVIIKLLVMYSVYERRPSRNDDESGTSFHDTIIAANASCLLYIIPFLLTRHTVHHIFQYISLILNSILLSVFWFAIAPEDLHDQPWSHVYITNACINSVQLLLFLLHCNSLIKKKNKIMAFPYAHSVPERSVVGSMNNSNSVQVSVSV